MKQPMESKVKKPIFYFKLLLIVALFGLASYPFSAYGQHRQLKIEKELVLSNTGSIKINGPESVRITGKGTIHTRQIADQYIVSRNSDSPHIYTIDKKLVVHTWDKNLVKQVSTISYACKTVEQEEELKAVLALNLAENAAGIVEIDCELNISYFRVKNGWFTTENNHIILDNGKVYPIEFLSISTTLYIPINSQVIIAAEKNDIHLDRHKGTLEIQAVGGSLEADEIHNLKGDFEFTKMKVQHLGNASLVMQNSSLKANSIEKLTLKSATSKLEVDTIEALTISKSLNDQFYLESVKSLKATNSVFSNYHLASCLERLDMTLKSGDLDIKNFGSSMKFAFIKNQNAKAQINLNNLESYSLLINSYNQSKYRLPDNFILTKSDDQAVYQWGENPEKTKIQIDCTHCEVTLHNTSQ